MPRAFNIGRGVVSVDGVSMGNCSSFSFSASAKTVEHVDFNLGIRNAELIVIEWEYSGNMVTDTLTVDNIKKALGSAVSGGTDVGRTITYVGAAGLSDAALLNAELPNAILDLGGITLITDTDWIKVTVNFKGKVTGTDKISIS